MSGRTAKAAPQGDKESVFEPNPGKRFNPGEVSATDKELKGPAADFLSRRSPSVQLAEVILKTFADQPEERLYRACDCIRKRLAYAYKKETRVINLRDSCVICEKCGFCITCGKCKTLGCGVGNSFESILRKIDERKALLKERMI